MFRETVYAAPDTVSCPRCDSPPAHPCVDDGGSPRARWHVARERRPIRYQCRHCDSPFSVSEVTGARVHIFKVDTTHSAEPYPDERRWRS